MLPRSELIELTLRSMLLKDNWLDNSLSAKAEAGFSQEVMALAHNPAAITVSRIFVILSVFIPDGLQELFDRP
jgi:hypothetical protein